MKDMAESSYSSLLKPNVQLENNTYNECTQIKKRKKHLACFQGNISLHFHLIRNRIPFNKCYTKKDKLIK